jgi:hypothetical protein
VNLTSNIIGDLLYNMEEKPSNEWNPSHNDIEPHVLFTELKKYNLSFYLQPEYEEINNITKLNEGGERMAYFNLLKHMLKTFQWKYDYITNQWYHNTYSYRQPRRSNRIRRRIPQSRTIPGSIPRRPSLSPRTRPSLSLSPRTRPSLSPSSRTRPSLSPSSISRRRSSNRIRRRRISNQY